MPPAATASQQQLQYSWFLGAPITKILCILWIIGHVIFLGSTTSSSSTTTTTTAAAAANRYFFVFGSTGEWIMVGALYLVPHLRALERELSSRQFIVWLAWIAILGKLAVAAFLFLLLEDEEDLPSTSRMVFLSQRSIQAPYLWVGGVLAWYARYVPRLYPQFISIAGIAMSEKALFLAWGVYILGYPGWNGNTSHGNSNYSLFIALCQGGLGAALCLAYFQWKRLLLAPIFDLLPMNSVLFHPRIVPIWETIGSLVFFLDPPPPIHVPLMMTTMPPLGVGGRRMGGAAPHSAVTGNRARRAAAAAAAAPMVPPPPPQQQQPPSQDLLDQLTVMGFDEERAREALTLSQNNLERAADRLLMG